MTGHASTFVIAYAIHKLFLPVRLAITFALTRYIVKRFNIKIPSTAEIRRQLQEAIDKAKDKVDK
jgi:hypothetical protein